MSWPISKPINTVQDYGKDLSKKAGLALASIPLLLMGCGANRLPGVDVGDYHVRYEASHSMILYYQAISFTRDSTTTKIAGEYVPGTYSDRMQVDDVHIEKGDTELRFSRDRFTNPAAIDSIYHEAAKLFDKGLVDNTDDRKAREKLNNYLEGGDPTILLNERGQRQLCNQWYEEQMMIDACTGYKV